MQQTGFSSRLSKHLDRPIVAACAVRPPNTILFSALGAGVGAGTGSIVGGGGIFTGIGAALGVVLGYLLVWLRVRGSGQSIAMALVLYDDRAEILRLGPLGTRPTGTYRTLPYAELTGAEARHRVLVEVRIVLHTAAGAVALDGGRYGVGAAPPVIEELRRRIAA